MTILVTGGSGFIGSSVCRRLLAGGRIVLAGFSHHPERLPASRHCQPVHLDLSLPEAAGDIVRSAAPTAVIHLGAMSALSACERDPLRAQRVNVEATGALARVCADVGAVMIFASTDQVHDGEHAPYRETDPARPCHVYGTSKLEAEARVEALGAQGLSLRIGLTYGHSPAGDRSASEQVVMALARGEPLNLFTDEVRTPILVDDVAAAIDELLDRMIRNDAELAALSPRVLNLGGPDRLSRLAFGERIARTFGLRTDTIRAVSRSDVRLGHDRPRDVSLECSLADRILDTKIRAVDDGLSTLHRSAARRPRHG